MVQYVCYSLQSVSNYSPVCYTKIFPSSLNTGQRSLRYFFLVLTSAILHNTATEVISELAVRLVASPCATFPILESSKCKNLVSMSIAFSAPCPLRAITALSVGCQVSHDL